LLCLKRIAGAAMGEMPMPGGWKLAMAWLPMCGQTWTGAALSFTGMWAVMMVAMMLPSLASLLWRSRLAAGAAVALGAGYFLVWTALGAIVFALGAVFAQAALQLPPVARAVPVSLAAVVLLAGAYQFTARKAHHLACCLAVPARTGTAWQQGVQLGLHCVRACAGLTAILLVIGVMDLRAMAVIAAACTAERLAPAGERVAWAVGAVSLVAGLYLMVGAAWLL
jgi:predicted metal-binding membrane protein